MKAPSLYLMTAHPLAAVAAGHCVLHQGPLVGGVACGRCWEKAIRDDERFAVENDLPRELVSDPDLVDQVAVDRALVGNPIRLTSAERSAAIGELRSRGTVITEIARLLHTNQQVVWRELRHQNGSGTAHGDAGAA